MTEDLRSINEGWELEYIFRRGDAPKTLHHSETCLTILTPAIHKWLKHIGRPVGNLRLASDSIELIDSDDNVQLVFTDRGFWCEVTRDILEPFHTIDIKE